MIERYQTEAMAEIWSEKNKFQKWLDVEIAVCWGWADEGVIPREVCVEIEGKADFSISRIQEIEDKVNHDMIAFVSNVAENVGPSGRYLHLGLTSSDVLDTASSLLIKESLSVILGKVKALGLKLLVLASEHKYTPCVGRTHGIHAEPTTFGLKLLNWYAQIQRDQDRLLEAMEQISFGKLSGAVGTYAHCPPSLEERVCARLGLKPDPVATQVIQRDRHAHVLNTLALLGCSLERFAVEIRHLQRTEVLEVMEPFGREQKGSSAMPHKKNPIVSERITGMSRLLRSYAMAAMENVALWHERDISHSSVERVIWPDSFHLVDYMLSRFDHLISGMQINMDRMLRNLNITRGLIYSQRVLLELVEKYGMNREDAYSVVQEKAMKCWEGERPFLELLWEDKRVSNLISRKELENLFDYTYYYKHVDQIFSRFLSD
ncbi:MAG: adenylosuccinate lyase [Synergistales bacterium]|nr:adenylosuccinate lyase [Synergistales bacterium]